MATVPSKEFLITRTLDAPRQLVWETFTQPEHLKHWWGPVGMTLNIARFELRPGGTFLYSMKTPDGHEMFGKWLFREIVAPEKLAFLVSFCDRQGNPVRHPMAPTWPLKMLGIMMLADQGSKTLLTNSTVAYEANAEDVKTFEAGFDSMKQGFGGTYDQLSAYLAKVQK